MHVSASRGVRGRSLVTQSDLKWNWYMGALPNGRRAAKVAGGAVAATVAEAAGLLSPRRRSRRGYRPQVRNRCWQ